MLEFMYVPNEELYKHGISRVESLLVHAAMEIDHKHNGGDCNNFQELRKVRWMLETAFHERSKEGLDFLAASYLILPLRRGDYMEDMSEKTQDILSGLDHVLGKIDILLAGGNLKDDLEYHRLLLFHTELCITSRMG